MLKLNVPENEKTQEWIESNILEIANSYITQTDFYTRDYECYRLYNNERNDNNYTYLESIGEYVFPSKIRFIPRVRSKLEVLRSEQSRRILKVSIKAVDKKNLKKRSTRQFQYIAQQVIAKGEEMRIQLNSTKKMYEFKKNQMSSIVNSKQQQYQQLNQQMQQQIQGLQQQEQTQQVVQQIQQLQSAMVDNMATLDNLQMEALQLEIELDKMDRAMKVGEIMSKKDLENIDKFLLYEWKDYEEESAQKCRYYLQNKLNIQDEGLRAFTDKLVTGREVYYVDFIPGDKLPIYRAITPMKVRYPKIDGVRKIQDCPWVILDEFMSINQVFEEFGKYLNYEQKKRLSEVYGYSDNGRFINMEGNTAYPSYIGSINQDASAVSVRRVFFKSNRKMAFGKNREFIDLSNVSESNVKNEISDVRYVSDVYEGVVIDYDIVVRAGKKPVQLRSIDNPSKSDIPIYGRTYNSLTERPYSLVWNTKDLQEMSDILFYLREKLIALSGVKGFIMDKSQIPDGMSESEWLYQVKNGVAYIESVKKGVRNAERASFNQFQTYDHSVTPSIQYIDSMLINIGEMISEITGVSRQRIGQIVNTDQVGTSKIANQQSALITEILFYEHDFDQKDALQALMHLAFKNSFETGEIIQYYDDKKQTHIFTVPADDLKEADFEVMVLNSIEEEEGLLDLKRLAFESFNKGILKLQEVIGLYSTKSLTELEKSLEYYSDKALEVSSKAQSDAMQAQKEFELEKIKMEAEYKLQGDKMMLSIQQMANEINAAKIDYDKSMKQIELSLAAMKVENDKYKVEQDINVKNRALDIEEKKFGLESTKVAIQEQQSMMDFDSKQRQMDMMDSHKMEDLQRKDKELSLKQEDIKNKNASKSI